MSMLLYPNILFVWISPGHELGWSLEAEEWGVKYAGDACPPCLR